MVAFSCPGCSKTFQVNDQFAGRKTKCPNCGAVLLVPAIAPQSYAESLALPDAARSDLPVVISSYIRQNLMPGERLIGITRIHPMVLITPSIPAAFGLLVCLLGIVAGERGIPFVVVGILIVVFAGFAVLALLVERLTTEYSCTDRRILIKTGLITTQLREMPLAKVEALLMEQGLFGKIFGYGTLVFKGSGGTRRACKSIEEPFKFYKRVQEQVAVAQQHK